MRPYAIGSGIGVSAIFLINIIPDLKRLHRDRLKMFRMWAEDYGVYSQRLRPRLDAPGIHTMDQISGPYSNPSAELYYMASDGEYLLQSYMENPEYGYSMATGKFVRITRDEMEAHGADIVLENLRAYRGREKREESSLEAMDGQACRRFYRGHKVVGVELVSDEELVMGPMEVDDEGAGTGDPAREVKLSLPCTNAEFLAALDQVFDGL